MFTIHRPHIVLTAALLVCLTACTPGDPGASSSTTATPKPSVSSTASPTSPSPSSTPPPATPEPSTAPGATLQPLASFVVTTEGFGPIEVGSAVPEDASGSAIVTWDPAYCTGDSGLVAGEPYAGAWAPNYPETESPALGTRRAFDVITADGVRDAAVRSINLWSPEASSGEGIRAGSTIDELLAAYPTFDEVQVGPVSTVYAINGSAGRLLFEVGTVPETGDLAGYWGDANNTVLWLRVVASGMPAAGIAGGDASGPCPV